MARWMSGKNGEVLRKIKDVQKPYSHHNASFEQRESMQISILLRPIQDPSADHQTTDVSFSQASVFKINGNTLRQHILKSGDQALQQADPAFLPRPSNQSTFSPKRATSPQSARTAYQPLRLYRPRSSISH